MLCIFGKGFPFQTDVLSDVYPPGKELTKKKRKHSSVLTWKPVACERNKVI